MATAASRKARQSASRHPALAAIAASEKTKVKVAVSDIDGVLRGKYLHRDKFLSAVEGGFGFCDVVFGWDIATTCYDNTKVTGWQHGYPDALARLDLDTHRKVPWDDNVDFFLGDFVDRRRQARTRPARASRSSACSTRAEKMGFLPMCRRRVRVLQLPRDARRRWAREEGLGPDAATPGMFGYSLLRAGQNRDVLQRADRRAGGVRHRRSRACTPRPAPACTRWRSATPRRSRPPTAPCCSRPAPRRSARATASCRPSWRSGTRSTRAAAATCTRACATARATNLFHDAKGRHAACRSCSRATSPASSTACAGDRADVLADGQQLQAPGRRLLGAGEAHLGRRQPHRDLPRDRRLGQGHAPRDALPGRRHEPVPRDGRAASPRASTASRRA